MDVIYYNLYVVDFFEDCNVNNLLFLLLKEKMVLMYV